MVLAIVLVNPLREALTPDDSRAYAFSVQHFLETGENKLHDWASVNMPVQICWVALLAKVFGYSFTILRLSTLVLFLVAIVSFYYMLRDFGTDDVQAALFTAAIASTSIIFFLSFTFQTDVQFLGWELLSLLLYTRAVVPEALLFTRGATLCLMDNGFNYHYM